MTETQRRIRAYKKALPELRERVIAVALLLAMSASMLASASFAWITLSTAPEVSGMATTVAANGNLEIALAEGSAASPAVAPDESAVGDSAAAQDMVAANVTWGNLVNVSDPKYGLDQIALRPALLSPRNLNITPLEGASYGQDGRVISTTDKYYYASWKDFNGVYRFASGTGSEYGVRAIVSTMQENITGNQTVNNYIDVANEAYSRAVATYSGLITGATKFADKDGNINSKSPTCISTLGKIVSVFAQDKVNAHPTFKPSDREGNTSISDQLFYLLRMMEEIQKSLEQEAEALLNLANAQAFRYQSNSNDPDVEVKEKNFADMAALRQAFDQKKLTSDYGVELVTLKQHFENYDKVLSTINDKLCTGVDAEGNEVPKSLYEIAWECSTPDDPSNPVYYWDNVEAAIYPLVDISTTTIGGYTVNEVTSHVDDLLGQSNIPVVLKKGLLRDIENRYIPKMDRMAEVKPSVAVTVRVHAIFFDMDYDLNGIVTTTAGQDANDQYDPDNDQDIGASGGTVTGGESVGKDTYGLALDLWLRTNYPEALLVLEGAAEYTEVRATHNGKPVSIMTYQEVDYEVYQQDANTSDWYYVDGDAQVPEEIVSAEGTEFAEKFDRNVTGYHGENRVWDDWEDKLTAGLIEKDATTQGAGSCFVFYADPTEQEKLMEMLDSFTVAFIDGNGDELGTAKLNTASAYANVGKITVPLEITSGVDYTDSNGAPQKAIMKLNQNEATRITAIVYLNGRNLQNSNVLASGELQGQLNIQFGTNTGLIAPENEEVMSQHRTITASVTVGDTTITNGTISGSGGEGLPYRPEGYAATVNLTVDGEQPDKITGFFVRAINEAQGARGEEINFTINADGTWTGAFTKDENGQWTKPLTLTSPGTYVLNTLIVDGVQYNLYDGDGDPSLANHPQVKIAGLNLANVICSVRGTHMVTENSMPVTVTATIGTDLNLTSVKAYFSREGDSNQYNITLTPATSSDGSDVWSGTANFNQSGQYTLKYITVDGDTRQTLDVPAGAQSTMTLYLGVTPRVYTGLSEENRTILLKDGDSQQIPMYVRVTDNSGAIMTNEMLRSVLLYYDLNDEILPGANPLPMSWNGSRNFFEGIMTVTSANKGNLTFDHLSISEKADGTNPSIFYSVEDAPSFKIADYNPPEWKGVVKAPERQLAINDGTYGTASVQILNGNGAEVWAYFTRTMDDTEAAEPIRLDSVSSTTDSSGIATFTFNLQEKVGNNVFVEGKWKLQKVYAKKAVNVDGEDTMKTFLLYDAASASETLETQVIQTVTPKLYYDGAAYSGPITLEGAGFLEEQTSKTVKVEAYDYTDHLIPELTGATWNFTHTTTKNNKNIQQEYSGYTDADGKPITEEPWTVDMTLNTETMNGVEVPKYVSMTEGFIYGGEYTTRINLKFTDMKGTAAKEDDVVHTFGVEKDNPVFVVKSVKPYAKITGHTKTGSYYTKITYTTRLGAASFKTSEQQTSSHSDYQAKLYAYAYIDSGLRSHGYYEEPTLTITVYGMGNADKASMTLPAGSANEITFAFTKTDTEDKRTLGKTSSKSVGYYGQQLENYYGHGDVQITYMILEKGDRAYKVTLDNALAISDATLTNY